MRVMVYLLPQVVSIIEENIPVAELIEMKQMGNQVRIQYKCGSGSDCSHSDNSIKHGFLYNIFKN
jgi:hypothetical protein